MKLGQISEKVTQNKETVDIVTLFWYKLQPLRDVI